MKIPPFHVLANSLIAVLSPSLQTTPSSSKLANEREKADHRIFFGLVISRIVFDGRATAGEERISIAETRLRLHLRGDP